MRLPVPERFVLISYINCWRRMNPACTKKWNDLAIRKQVRMVIMRHRGYTFKEIGDRLGWSGSWAASRFAHWERHRRWKSTRYKVFSVFRKLERVYE